MVPNTIFAQFGLLSSVEIQIFNIQGTGNVKSMLTATLLFIPQASQAQNVFTTASVYGNYV